MGDRCPQSARPKPGESTALQKQVAREWEAQQERGPGAQEAAGTWGAGAGCVLKAEPTGPVTAWLRQVKRPEPLWGGRGLVLHSPFDLQL